MSEEILNNNEETKCICQNKSFRNILTIAVGSFVGVFCALSLFCALHKPPMMPMHPMMMGGFHGHHKIMGHKHFDCPCKKHMKKFIKEQENFKTEFDNKVENKD